MIVAGGGDHLFGVLVVPPDPAARRHNQIVPKIGPNGESASRRPSPLELLCDIGSVQGGRAELCTRLLADVRVCARNNEAL